MIAIPPEMGRIWSDGAVANLVAHWNPPRPEAIAAAGIVPARPRDIRDAAPSTSAASRGERSRHDVIAFTTAVAEKVGSQRAG